MRKLLLLTLLSTVSVLGQSTDDFSGAADTINNDRYDWKKFGGSPTDANASFEIDGSGMAFPYHPSGPTSQGGIIWDSSLSAPTNGALDVYMVVGQKSATNNTRTLCIFLADTNAFGIAGTGGYSWSLQENTGTDFLTGKEFTSTVTPTAGNNTPPSPYASTAFITREFAATDTIGIRVWNVTPQRITLWHRPVAGTIDSTIVFTDETYNVKAHTYVGLWGAEQTTPSKATGFGIRTIGAGGGPPATEVSPPVLSSITFSNSSPLLGQSVTMTVSATDDSSGVNKITFDTSRTGTFIRFDSSTTAAGTLSTSFTSKSFTRGGSAIDSFKVRARASDHSGKLDTSDTFTIYFLPATTGGGDSLNIAVTVYNPSWTLFMGAGTNGNSGPMPADSIRFNAMSHYIAFASSPTAAGGINYGNLVSSRRGPFNARVHAAGKPSLLCIGGAGGSGNFNSATSTANRLTFINTILAAVRADQWDGIDIDWEPFGTGDTTNCWPFIRQLYDSFQTMSAYYNAAKKPMIFFTLNPGGNPNGVSAACRNLNASIRYVQYFQIMNYDKMGNWTNETYFDYAPYSRINNVIVDRIGTTGQEMATAQMQANVMIAGGVNPAHITIGIDFMLGVAGLGSGFQVTGGNGPTRPRQNYIGTPANSAFNVDCKFSYGDHCWRQYVNGNSNTFWDDTAKTYYAFVDSPGFVNDRFISFAGGPGSTPHARLDSSLWYHVKLAKDMGLGGIMIWDLGETYLDAANYPSATYPGLNRNWLLDMMDRVIGGIVDTSKVFPPAPQHVSPANGATNQSLTPTLTITAVTGFGTISKYWYQWDTVSFTGPASAFLAQDSSGASVTKVLPSLPNSKTVYWRVAAKNADGWGGFSNNWSFTTIPATPAVPTLVSPANAATGQTQSLTLIWSAAAGAASYQAQVDNDAGFGSPHADVSGLTVTQYVVSGLANSTTYHWRVRATNAGGTSAYSSSRSFTTTAAAPNPPTLVLPINGASNQATSPTFSWTNVAGADSFQFQLDDDPAFGSTFKDTNIVGSILQVGTLTNSTTYYWRVRSKGQAGNSSYTASFSFAVGADVQPPAPGSQARVALNWDPNKVQWVGAVPPGLEMGNVSLGTLLRPTDSTSVMASPFGYKRFNGDTVRYRTTADAAGSGTMTAAQILDSLQTLTLDSLILRRPQIREYADFRPYAEDSGRHTIVGISGNPSGSNNTVGISEGDGDVAYQQGTLQDVYYNSANFGTALNQPSGGFGTTPSAANTAGYSWSLWGYSPSLTEWSLFPLSTLTASPFGLLSLNGITGGKQPYVTGAGAWAFRDTTGAGTVLTDAVDDSMKAWLIVRDSNAIQFFDQTFANRGLIRGTDEGIEYITNNTTTAQAFMGNSNKSVGVNIIGNSGTEVKTSASGQRVLRVRTTTTNSDPVEDWFRGRVATADATPATGLTVFMDSALTVGSDYSADPMAFDVWLTVVANRTDSAGVASYTRRLVYQKDGSGVVSEIAEQTIGTDVEGTAALAIGIAPSGDNFVVTVTGVAGEDWVWHTHAKVKAVGN